MPDGRDNWNSNVDIYLYKLKNLYKTNYLYLHSTYRYDVLITYLASSISVYNLTTGLNITGRIHQQTKSTYRGLNIYIHILKAFSSHNDHVYCCII